MRKIGIVSLAVAALLLSGCNQKKEEHAAVKKAASQSVVSSSAVSSSQAAPEPLPGVPMEPAKKVQSSEAANTQAQESMQHPQKEVAKGVEKVKEAAAAVAAATGAKAAEEKSNQAPAQEEVQESSEAAVSVDGAKLYVKCASCHGQKGDRKALGKSNIIAGMAKDEVLKKLKGYQAGTLNQYGMGPLMKGQVAGLDEVELEALADYISKLK